MEIRMLNFKYYNEVRLMLELHFPWLGTEDDANGGDTVEEVCALYHALNDGDPIRIKNEED